MVSCQYPLINYPVCHKENVNSLVDVGSGKAYLSQVLSAMQKHLAILAIDSQSGNLKGAQKRSANLEVSLQKLFIPFIKLHNEIKTDFEIIYF